MALPVVRTIGTESVRQLNLAYMLIDGYLHTLSCHGSRYYGPISDTENWELLLLSKPNNSPAGRYYLPYLSYPSYPSLTTNYHTSLLGSSRIPEILTVPGKSQMFRLARDFLGQPSPENFRASLLLLRNPRNVFSWESLGSTKSREFLEMCTCLVHAASTPLCKNG